MRNTYLAKLAQVGSVAAVAALAVVGCGGDGDSGARKAAGGVGGSGGAGDTGQDGTGGGAKAGAGGTSGGSEGTGGGGGKAGSSGNTTANACAPPTDTAPDPVIYSGVTTGASCKSTIDSPYVGGWFKYSDGTVTETTGDLKAMALTPSKGGCDNDCAVHVTGAGFTDYGAGIGFDVKDEGSQPTNFDASAFGGIQFAAKGTLKGTRGKNYAIADNNIHLKLSTATGRGDDDYGGYCEIKADWTLCQFPFADLTRDGFKNAEFPTATDKLDIDKLLKIQLEFSRATDGTSPLDFDVWIDNVAFYGKPGLTSGGGGGTEQLGEDVCKLSADETPKSVIYSGSKAAGTCSNTTNTPYSTYWFKYDDKTAVTEDPDGKAMTMAGATGGCQSDCAIHSTGAGYKDYGAGIGFDLKADQTGFDGSEYQGVQFFAKGTLTGTRAKDYSALANTIHMKIPTATGRGEDEYGAYCTVQADTWTNCRFKYSNLARDGFKDTEFPVASDSFDQDKMTKIQFEFSRYTGESGSTQPPITFDVWVDNVSFF